MKHEKVTAQEWFTVSTCAIDNINMYANMQLKHIDDYITKTTIQVKEQRIQHFIFWLFGLLVLLTYVFISFKKSKELLKEQTLLKNYKNAIDSSALISTTDVNGIITHVNQAFCDVSGYTQEEFLGSYHTLISYIQTKDDIYKEMREILNKNKVWSGTLKNRTKDGKAFWTDTTVFPIFDDQNNLAEYITISHDISDIIHLHKEIEETQSELIYRLGEAVESRSKESGYHIKRVMHYAKLLGNLYGLTEEECETLYAAASMHDVGKIAIPDAILLKPAKLTADEWKIMKTHAEIGYNLFENSQRPLLKSAAIIALDHHEHFDGQGYPRGIKGEEISLFGRIVAIADVFDALSTKRVYKEIWSQKEVTALFEKESGKQFDPILTQILLDNIDEFLKIRDKYQ